MLDLEQIRTFYPEAMRPFGRGLLREYLQYRILEAIAEQPAASRLRFMGGTCIHLVHGSPRFSEDLNFDNLHISFDAFDAMCEAVRADLAREGYRVECATSRGGAFRADLRFPGLLRQQGLSGHAEEKLSVKIDTAPQDFDYEPESVILSKFDVLLRINVAPVELLLAQKMLCILNRKRPMGRDFFDVAHLIGKTAPNMTFLNAKAGIDGHEALRERLLARWRALDSKALVREVSPFLHRSTDVKRIAMFGELIESWRPAQPSI